MNGRMWRNEGTGGRTIEDTLSPTLKETRLSLESMQKSEKPVLKSRFSRPMVVLFVFVVVRIISSFFPSTTSMVGVQPIGVN